MKLIKQYLSLGLEIITKDSSVSPKKIIDDWRVLHPGLVVAAYKVTKVGPKIYVTIESGEEK